MEDAFSGYSWNYLPKQDTGQLYMNRTSGIGFLIMDQTTYSVYSQYSDS